MTPWKHYLVLNKYQMDVLRTVLVEYIESGPAESSELSEAEQLLCSFRDAELGVILDQSERKPDRH